MNYGNAESNYELHKRKQPKCKNNLLAIFISQPRIAANENLTQRLKTAGETVAQLNKDKEAIETDRKKITDQLRAELGVCQTKLNAEESKTKSLSTDLSQLQGSFVSCQLL